MANQLIHSRSPYLLQHANNPVDWRPWDEETLQLARKENKLMIISIGYSACHWCHVMEHESFEDEEVAALMNKYYISVKVDREERPDVDQVYMNAAMLINGNGGWPLNAIALPDGRPVYAGTYFPKQNWLRVLAYFADIYQKDPKKLEEQAQKLTEGIRSLDQTPPLKTKTNIDPTLLDLMWQNWKPHIDMEYGGRKGAPKFMMPNQYFYLLKYAHSSGKEDVKAFIQTTLNKMALGGLYDALAGGFTRYSTDPYWKVPHFEKMLYDNAQLLGLYAQAYKAFGNPLYLEIVRGILYWLDNEMMAPDGGYYSALDADSEGQEGKYYVWTYKELKDILGEDTDLFAKYYCCTPSGNWEHGQNVLHATETPESYAKANGLDPEIFQSFLHTNRQKLLNVRSRRIRPGLDDKRIAGWNALLLSGLVEAYWATGDGAILEKAKSLADFFTQTLTMPDGGLWHTYNKGHSYLQGYLSDYAPAMAGFILLYQATGEERYLLKAYDWLDYVIEHFYDEQSGFFFLTSDASENLVSRPKELNDNVISASNSILARVLWQMGHCFDKPFLKEMANYMLQHVLQDTVRNGAFYAEWASLLWEMNHPFYEVVFSADNNVQQVNQLMMEYLPEVLVIHASPDTRIPLAKEKPAPYIYVCRNYTCLAPVKQVAEVLEILKNQGLLQPTPNQ